MVGIRRPSLIRRGSMENVEIVNIQGTMVLMMICPELLNQHRDVPWLPEHLDLLLHGSGHQSHRVATDLKFSRKNKKEGETESTNLFPALWTRVRG